MLAFILIWIFVSIPAGLLIGAFIACGGRDEPEPADYTAYDELLDQTIVG